MKDLEDLYIELRDLRAACESDGRRLHAAGLTLAMGLVNKKIWTAKRRRQAPAGGQ